MEKQICKDYNEKFLTIAELAKKYKKDSNNIRHILKENNVHIRSCSENAILKRVDYKYTLDEIKKEVIDKYVNQNCGLISSGKKFGLTSNNVKYILNKNNIYIRNFGEAASVSNENRAYQKNILFFQKESNDMAWLLGFLASDGTISKNSNSIKIGLAKKDREILEKIKSLVQIENPITERTTNKGYDVVELTWSCKQHKKDLEKYGIIPNKTFKLNPPYKLNKNFWIDYIRGYFDGDGSVNLIKNSNRRGNGNLRWQICSVNKAFLQWIIDFLYEAYNIPKVNVHVQSKNRETPLYYFQYSSVATRQIYKILYNDSQMFLKRKRDRYEQILTMITPMVKNPRDSIS